LTVKSSGALHGPYPDAALHGRIHQHAAPGAIATLGVTAHRPRFVMANSEDSYQRLIFGAATASFTHK
jgi:hypothetical protein